MEENATRARRRLLAQKEKIHKIKEASATNKGNKKPKETNSLKRKLNKRSEMKTPIMKRMMRELATSKSISTSASFLLVTLF